MTQNLLDAGSDREPEIDPNKNYLEELVGEGKKFKSPEDLAKGKFLADHYVNTLESQLDALREDYLKLREEADKGPALQELLDQLKKPQTSNDNTPNVNAANNAPNALDPDQLKSLVSSEVTRIRTTEKEQDNYNTVLGKVKERYGNNYANVLKEKATELALTDDEVNSMARRNPKLFMKTFEVDAPRNDDNFQTPPNNSARRDSFAPRTDKRTQSYYSKLRREKPTEYFLPKTQIQMDRDLRALGEAFFDLPR